MCSCQQSACWVFSCFRNPPDSEIDYRIFNVRTWLFVCVRVHTGVGHTDCESAHRFWFGKTPTQAGFDPLIFWIFGSGIRRSSNWATPSKVIVPMKRYKTREWPENERPSPSVTITGQFWHLDPNRNSEFSHTRQVSKRRAWDFDRIGWLINWLL